MISDILNTPVLAIAIDDMPSIYNDAINSISEAIPEVSDSEILSSLESAKQFTLSDVNDKLNRLYLPITDKLLPIHYTASNSSSGKTITYDTEGIPNIAEAGNTYTLQFEISNNLTTLSTISDILYAIVTKNSVQQASHPRVSFYGGSLCIFNAYLIGVTRATVSNTDKEIIGLTLEASTPRPASESAAEGKPWDGSAVSPPGA